MKPRNPPNLPRGWSKHIKSSVVQAIALAATALSSAWGRNAAGRSTINRLEVKLDRANTEIAMLREELAIKDARWGRLPSRRRPYYSPVERLRILQLKAARGWSRQQAAYAFLINEQTLRSWLFRVDEQGERALIQTADPVNKFPDFVRYLVKQLKALLPTMGKVRLAQLLARAGLHLGATTIARIWRETDSLPEDAFGAAPEIDVTSNRVVTAKYPGHTWHLDLTTVPTWSGFWVPWMPFAVPQSWPFCWWVAVAVDHFSRAVVCFSVFFKRPTSAEVQQFLNRANHRTGQSPKYVITDKGSQFWCKSFKQWCRRKSIRPRFGAVGKYGSIAVVERFMRSLKSECTRRILVPLRLDTMRRELTLYIYWYNQFRPSIALGGRTPREVRDALRPANAKPRFEPRPRWPKRSPCAAPQAAVKGTRGTKLRLVVGYVEGRKHLPVVELRRAA